MPKFMPYGPFKLPILRRRIDRYQLEDFFEKNGCGGEIGIYVFTLRTSQGAEYPYYVGKTENSFEAECFTSGKIEKYNEVLAFHRGSPWMYFLVLETKFNAKAIRTLEKTMIGLGMKRNPDMRNIMHTRRDDIDVADVLGSSKGKGARLKSASNFRRAIGIK